MLVSEMMAAEEDELEAAQMGVPLTKLDRNECLFKVEVRMVQTYHVRPECRGGVRAAGSGARYGRLLCFTGGMTFTDR